MDFQSAYNHFPPIPVTISRKTKTVPDMSYSPREIIAKFSRGEKVPLGFNGLFDSEDDQEHLSDYEASYFEDDPTRDLDFDQWDYAEEKVALDERQAERKKRSNRKTVSDSKRKASAEELSASDATKRETTSGESKQSPPGQQVSGE